MINQLRSVARPGKNWPLVALTLGVLLTNTLTGYLALLSYFHATSFSSFLIKATEIQRLKGEIVHLDEVLTMSAKMAAATGDLAWRSRYDEFDPKLIAAIDALSPLIPDIKPTHNTDVANQKLVNMERRSFDFIQNNQHQQALNLLTSPEYELEKAKYADGMKEVSEKMDTFVKSERMRFEQDFLRSVQSAIVLLLLSIFGWVYVFSALKNWGAAILELNRTLDERVREKTMELGNQMEVQRQVELKLVASSKLAALGEVAGGIAHEINNPLAIIQGKSRRIKRTLSEPSEVRDSVVNDVDKILETCERIAKIVSGMRIFSRNADNDPFNSCNTRELITDCLGLCQEKFKHAGIDIRANNIAEIEFDCRATQIAQVLVNLLTNSHDAIQDFDTKWIQLDVKALDVNHVQFIVIDSGSGISESIAEKIMQPFFTTKEIGKGTGLGLSISRGIVEDHGGTLTLDRDAANTKFVVELPIRQVIGSPRVRATA
jgi:C4-dicarboxylate-specific signal transduction histidine kinase